MPLVPFAPWRPDVSAVNSQFVADVVNVLWATDAYGPFPQLVPFTLAAPSQPLWGFTARAAGGQAVIFIGTATRLYKLNTSTLAWDDVSQLAADTTVNGTFAADVSWTKGAGWTIAGGVGVATAVAAGLALNQAQAFVAGTTYKVTFTVSGYSAGGVRPAFVGGTNVLGTTVTANGTYTEYLTALTGNNLFYMQASITPTTLNIDNVTLQALTSYGATVDERWQFTQFGDHVIAVNVNDNPQVYDLSSSTVFADLAGSPPRARHVAVWGDFVALGGLSGFENRVHWSGLDDDTEWTPGTNNCDFQDFPDGGDVQGMTDATNPIVIQRSAIRFGTFVPGSLEVFTFQKVHDRRGAVAPYSICSRGAFTFFADSGGFFQIFTDGSLKEIGLEKVDRTVFTAISGTDIAAIIAAVDPFYNRVYFAVRYDSVSSSFDRLIIYDWGVGEWTQAVATTNIMFPLASATVGYTLEGLDAISASLDALSFSLDSRVWQGGAPVMAAVDADFRLGFYSGPNAEAILTTQEVGDTSGAMTRITEVMPIVDTNTVFLSFGTRNKRGDTAVWSGERAPSSNTGIIHGRSRARFHSIKMRIPADVVWTHAQAVNLKTAPAGLR